MNRIFKYISVFLWVSMTLGACGSKNESRQNLTYAEAYDQIIMRISLDSISDLSGINPQQLIGVRFGLINEDDKLTTRMVEILNALEDNDRGKLNRIGKSKLELSLKNNGSKIEEKEIKAIYASRNKEFGQALPDIQASFLNDNIDDYIDEKYDLLTVIPNTWKYYTKSDEEFTNDFLSDFEISGLQHQSDEFYVSILNNYKNNLSEEIQVLTNSAIEIPDFKALPGDESIESNSILKDLIIQRTKSQIKEISSDIIWEFILVSLICAILAVFMDKAIDKAIENALEKLKERLRWKKGDSLGKNIVRFGFTTLGVHDEYKEEKQAIISRYERYKKIVNISVCCLGFLFTLFFIIKPQRSIENELNEELSAALMDSSSTLQINPERVLNLYLNINDEDYNNADMSVFENKSNIESQAVKELYRIFYLNEQQPYATISKDLKQKFEELGISSTTKNPYTTSLQSEINRMESMAQEVGDLSFGFDSDILHFGQGDIVDMNLDVVEVKAIDENTVSIRARYHNFDDYDRNFVMKNENGTFKIDDMDNIRSFIKEELKNAEQYLKETDNEAASDSRQIKFSGKIGKSPIVLELNKNQNVITGKYAYQSTLKKYGNKPESYFYLSGKIDEAGNLNMVSKMYKTDKPFEYITLSSPEFHKGSVISGELQNANNGDSFIIELKME